MTDIDLKFKYSTVDEIRTQLPQFFSKLRPYGDLDPDLVQQYNVCNDRPGIDKELSSLLLAKNGCQLFQMPSDDDVPMPIWKLCVDSRCEAALKSNLPTAPLAIANQWEIGNLLQWFYDHGILERGGDRIITEGDIAVTTPVYQHASFTRLFGTFSNGHWRMQSNSFLTAFDMKAVVSQMNFPKHPRDVPCRILLSGFGSEKSETLKKALLVTSMAPQIVDFFVDHNKRAPLWPVGLTKGMDGKFIKSVSTGEVNNGDGDFVRAEDGKETDKVNKTNLKNDLREDLHYSPGQLADVTVSTTTVLIEENAPPGIVEALRSLISVPVEHPGDDLEDGPVSSPDVPLAGSEFAQGGSVPVKTYRVQASNQAVNYKRFSMDEMPHKVPFGTDVFDEGKTRRVFVSLRDGIQHLMKLSGGEFQDAKFACLVRRSLMLADAKRRLLVVGKVQVDVGGPTRMETFVQMDDQQFALGLSYRQKCQQQSTANLPHPPPPDGLQSYARDFFTTVGAAYRTFSSINFQEKARCYSHVYKYNEGSYWLTITPDQTAQVLIFLFALGNQSNEEVRSRINNAAERWKILSAHPVACVLFFHRFLQIFEKYILGWDHTKKRSTPDGGLYGVLASWLYGIEPQQLGNLHIHVVIWVCILMNLRLKFETLMKIVEEMEAAADWAEPHCSPSTSTVETPPEAPSFLETQLSRLNEEEQQAELNFMRGRSSESDSDPVDLHDEEGDESESETPVRRNRFLDLEAASATSDDGGGGGTADLPSDSDVEIDKTHDDVRTSQPVDDGT